MCPRRFERDTVMAAKGHADQSSGPAEPSIPRQQAVDMTAPETFAKLDETLDKGRRPDVTLAYFPRRTIILAVTASSGASNGAHRSVCRSRSAASRHPARQPARKGVLRRRRLRALSRSPAGGLPARGGRGVGLLPDAEPRPSDPDPADARGLGAGARQGAPALFGLRQRADAGDWPSFSGALFLGRDGRGPPDGGGALWRAEPGPGKTRRNARGLALVERARPSRRPRRRAGRGRALTRALRRALSRSHRRGARSRKNRGAARRRDDRPSARRRGLPRPRCGPDRARPAAGQTGAQEPRRAGRRGGSAPRSKKKARSRAAGLR